MMNARFVVAAAAVMLAAIAGPAWAGPPFLTDDPEPVDYHHYEFYTFATTDVAADGATTNGPAFEYNYGAAPNVQFHVVIPFVFSAPAGAAHTAGLGDAEVGVKYRFVQETRTRPQIGVFPMAELATGSASSGLGNGVTWYRLPVWIQKSWGAWTSYGGGGFAINRAPGMRDYAFAGALLQRDFSPFLTLGGELYTQGSPRLDGRPSTFYNVGGYLKPSSGFNILFSVGHTVSGDPHAIAYFGLYWTGATSNAR
jgi:hypothetical protein